MPICTLIAADSLESGNFSEAKDRLAEAGCTLKAFDWLAEGKAVDISFAGDLADARTALAGLEDRVDIALITVECIDELADYAVIKPEIAAITERAMAGELDFADALKARVALLAGLDENVLAHCLRERVQPMPGAKILVRTMTGWGAHAVLVSGGFTSFTGPVADRLGFHAVHANVLEIKDGRLTGALAADIVDASTKQAVLQSAAEMRGIDLATTLAVGDGANDLPMIAAAVSGGGLGVGYHPRPQLAQAANFSVRHNDLTALLFAQGIKPDAWAD